MKNGILAIALAAGTAMMGVEVAGAAEGDRFVFRGKPGVLTVAAAAAPEEPAVFDVRQLTIARAIEHRFSGVNESDKISVGATFFGSIEIDNPQPIGGVVEVSIAGIPGGYHSGTMPPRIECLVEANGRTVCEQTITVSQAEIDLFCNHPFFAKYAGKPASYTPWALAEWGSLALVPSGQSVHYRHADC